MAWNFDVFIATATAAAGDWPGRASMRTTIAHQARLGSGSHVVLLAHRDVVSENTSENIEGIKARMIEATAAAPEKRDLGNERSFMTCISGADQTPFFLDLAAPELGLR